MSFHQNDGRYSFCHASSSNSAVRFLSDGVVFPPLEEPPLYLKGNVAFAKCFSAIVITRNHKAAGTNVPPPTLSCYSHPTASFPHRSRGFPAVKNNCLLFLPLATLAVQPVITCWLSFQTEGAAAPLPVVRRHRLVALCVCACTCLCSVFNPGSQPVVQRAARLRAAPP